MSKQQFKPGNMLYPLPVVFVTGGDLSSKDPSDLCLMTAAWTGTVCSDPAMTYVSIRPSRYSHDIIEKHMEFALNLPTAALARKLDHCGVISGRDENKFETQGLTPIASSTIKAPLIEECPVNIECKVTQILRLGSHDMFLAKVSAVWVDDRLMDEEGRLHLEKADLISYSHGQYMTLGRPLGSFGYSVRRKPAKSRSKGTGSGKSDKGGKA